MSDTLNPYRLPRTILPSRYDLTLSPDLGQRDFVGRAVITVDVHQPTAQIVCNAADLVIDRAWVVDPNGVRIDTTAIELDATTERCTITLARTLVVGEAKLTYEFQGVLNDKLVGFYASTYEADDGTTKVIATTQMEATDARRAFPCWDEPDFKAVFGVTLVVDEALMAISNSPVINEDTLPSGKRSVHFGDTMKMSTYLVCFVVGELEATEAIDVDGVPLRVIHRPGMAHLTQFALDIGAFSLRYFTEYYDIAYPGDKLDLLALPDFAAGAMENLGAITFREMLLLVDPTVAAKPELERIADVVAHEIAHMWFGDLVTMKWWNGLWLNEAFATFMEIACVDAWKPEWDRWTSFSVYRSMAMAVDGLHSTRPIEFPVVSPTDANGMFDVLTYEKGAAVLRMLEQYLGVDRFRDGVRHYLRAHSYANAETTDLWDSIEEVTGEPVRQMMDTWIFQGGFPLITASVQNSSMTLLQSRFSFLPDAAPGSPPKSWQVPVLYRAALNAGLGRLSLGTEPAVVTLAPGETAPVVNAGGHGFYRVRYDATTLGALRNAVHSLAPVERYGLVSDTWAAVLSGVSPASDFVALAKGFQAERDPNVWSALLGGLGSLDQIAGDDARPGLQAMVTALCSPALTDLGWTAIPDEAALAGQVRAQIISALGNLARDPQVTAAADALLPEVLDGGEVDPDVAPAIVSICSHQGDSARWDRYNEIRSTTTNPQLVQRFLHGLGGFEHPHLRQRTLELFLSGSVRTQDTAFAFVRMCSDRVNGPDSWIFVRDHWAEIVAKVPANAVVRLVEGLVQRSEPGVAEDILAFYASTGVPQGEKQLAQHMERLRVHQALRAREAAGLAAVFAV